VRDSLALAKCYCCGASATAPTFEQAIKKLNHAIGKSRGIRCRALRENIKEMFVKPIIPPTKPKPKTKELVESTKYFEELKKELTTPSEGQEQSKTENPPVKSETTIKKEKPKKEKKSKKSKAKKE